MIPTIAFNSANLVAYYSDNKFKLEEWSKQHALVSERTGLEQWQEICRKIRSCGFDAIEVWIALVERCADDPQRAQKFGDVMRSSALQPVALAGPLTESTVRVCKQLGIPCACGGYWGTTKEQTRQLMRDSGILFNYENHPESTIDQIRQQIDFGSDGMAIALDTGWLATQGIDAPQAVRSLGRLIRHVHLKDVAESGAHATVKLGTGVVDIPGVIKELKAIGYQGVLSWEDEPTDRNVFDIAAEMHGYIEQAWMK